jgi:NADPH2:quinone reductase
MRAWRFDEPGDIGNLRLAEVDLPELREGEVLVRVETAALNPADRYLVQGQYPRAGTPPFTPGRDGCGVVEQAVPNGRFCKGDRVVLLGGLTGISAQGMLAEYAAIPESWLAPMPPGWNAEEAAAGPLVLLTAWRALTVCGRVQPGETVLVTRASGGVGTAAVLLAKALEAKVVALSRSPEKRARLEELGADITLDAGAADLGKQIKAATDGGRIDLVVENLGGAWLKQAVQWAGYGGRIMVVGLLAGLEAAVPVGLLIHKCLRIEGLSVSAYAPEHARAAWERIVELLHASGHRPPVDRVYDMADVQAAFAHLAAGPLGKVVIAVSGGD